MQLYQIIELMSNSDIILRDKNTGKQMTPGRSDKWLDKSKKFGPYSNDMNDYRLCEVLSIEAMDKNEILITIDGKNIIKHRETLFSPSDFEKIMR